MILKNLKKRLIISLFVIIIIIVISVVNIRNKKVNLNLVLAKYYPSEYTACKLSYKTYEMLMGGYSILTKGNEEDSNKFPGFSFFEYIVPQCDSWNNNSRPKLFNYQENGGFYIQGNMVTNGYKTFFSGDGHGLSLQSFMRPNSTASSEDNIEYIGIDSKNNITARQTSIIKDDWLYHGGKENDNYLGSSIFLNSKPSKIKFGPASIEPRADSKIVSSTLEFLYDFKWNEWNKDNDLLLDDPSDFEFEYLSGENDKGTDCLVYIADKGRKKIIQYDVMRKKTKKELGDFYWNWEIEGLTLATTTCGMCNFTKEQLTNHDGDRTIYLSDSAKNRIIHTEIDGENWATSFDNEYWDYYTNLFITGEEVFQYEGITTSTINGIEDIDVVKKAVLKNSGFAPKDISIISTNQIKYNTDLQKNETGVIQKNDHIFGEHSFYFDGNSALATERHNSYIATDDNIFIDFWFKADNNFYSKNTTFVDYADNLKLKYDVNDHKLKLAVNQIDNNKNKEFNDIIVSPEWYPDTGEWYYIGLSRLYNKATKKSDFYLYTDDTDKEMQKISAKEIENVYFNGNQLILGGEMYCNGIEYDKCAPISCFKGNIDNFRFMKGFDEYNLDKRVIHPYYFNKPRGLAFNYANNKIYVVDNKSDRIVIMDDDFSKWAILGKNNYGNGRYEFNNPVNIDIHKNNFYIVDQGNQRIIKTNIIASSSNFRNLDTKYNSNSWNVLDLQDYYPQGANNEDFYNDGDIMYDYVYKNLDGKILNSHHNTLCRNFNTVNINISNYIKNRIYGNREIYVYFDSNRIKGRGNVFVYLTKNPGKTVSNNYSNSGLNLIGTNIQNGVKFKLPPRIDVDWSGDLYLSFGSCDEYSVKISNIRVTMAKEFIPSAISIVDNNIVKNKLFISDIENAAIVDAGINPFSITDTIHGGKNPEEYYNKYVRKNNGGNSKIIMENYRHKIKFSSPIDIHVIASSNPSNPRNKYIYHVLDGVSETDIAISQIDDEQVNFLGTPQSRAINIELEGGTTNIVKNDKSESNYGEMYTPIMDTWGVFNLWRKWYNMDYHKMQNVKFAESAKSEHKIWVGCNLGPGIAHCDEQENIGSTIYRFVGGIDTSCGYNFSYHGTDRGQECHNFWWQANSAIDVGTTLEACLYTNNSLTDTRPIDFPLLPPACDPYNGSAVDINCQQIAELRGNEPTTDRYPPVPYSECIGQWDWYSQWPFCTYYKPEFNRKRVCDEYFPNCVPLGVAQAQCHSVSCNGSLSIGTCINDSWSSSCGCGACCSTDDDGVTTCAPPGNCSLAGGCIANTSITTCNTCSNVNGTVTCHDGSFCQTVTCSYSNTCHCNSSGACCPCSGSFDCPDTWQATEANDCCKKWHWECQAACNPENSSCFEGHAVRWRDDYKGVSINYSNGNLKLRFFYDKNPTPCEMETLIKNIEQEVYSPYNLAGSSHYHKMSEIKDSLLKSGIIISNYSGYSNDKSYLDSLDDKEILGIKFIYW